MESLLVIAGVLLFAGLFILIVHIGLRFFLFKSTYDVILKVGGSEEEAKDWAAASICPDMELKKFL